MEVFLHSKGWSTEADIYVVRDADLQPSAGLDASFGTATGPIPGVLAKTQRRPKKDVTSGTEKLLDEWQTHNIRHFSTLCEQGRKNLQEN